MNVRKLLFFSAMTIAAFWVLGATYEQRQWFHINRVQFALNQGDFEEVCNRANELTGGNQQSPRLGLLWADALIQQGDFGQASELLQKLPESFTQHYLKGICDLQTSSDLALRHFEACSRYMADSGSSERKQLAQAIVACIKNDAPTLVNSAFLQSLSDTGRESLRLQPEDENLTNYLSGCRMLMLSDFRKSSRLFDCLGTWGLDNTSIRTRMAAAKAMDWDFSGASFYLDDDSTEILLLRLSRFKDRLTSLRKDLERTSYDETELTHRRMAQERANKALAWANLMEQSVNNRMTTESATAAFNKGVPEISIADLWAKSGNEQQCWLWAKRVAESGICLDAQLLANALETGQMSPPPPSINGHSPNNLLEFDVSTTVPDEWEPLSEQTTALWECELPLNIPVAGSYRVALCAKPLIEQRKGIGVEMEMLSINSLRPLPKGRFYFGRPFYGVQSLTCQLPAGEIILKFRFQQTQKQSHLYLNKIFLEKVEDLL